MAKKRVYELAKEKGVSNKEILWVLGKINIDVKSHMSALEDEDELKINDYYMSLEEKVKESQKQKAIEKIVLKEQERVAQVKKEEAEALAKEVPEEPAKTIDKPKSKPVVVAPKQVQKDSLPKKTPVKKTVKEEPKKNLGEKKKDLVNSAVKSKEQAIAREEKKKQDFKQNKNQSKDNRWNPHKKPRRFKKNHVVAEEKPEVVVKKVVIGEEIQIKELAMRVNKTAGEIIGKLMAMGVMANINQYIDFETAEIVLTEFGVEEVEFKSIKRQTKIEVIEDDPSTLKKRPPIITVMGHVDHGKTSLLDAIRSANVLATEAGGITQHIGAYQVSLNGQKITFIDTPGHAAFTSMRARGAKVTDIAILVVAADDGVMPQTIEAISHAKAAEVPIIVAVNKIDKPGADPDRVKQQLTEYGLIPEAWGGDTIFVEVSAKQKENIDSLLEMILLVAEVEDLKANPNRLAEGFVIEARLDKEKGTIATLLVTKGTLKVGNMILSGEAFGKVKAMTNEVGKNLNQAGPAAPVEVLGLSNVPEAGEIFQVIKDEKLASHLANERKIVKKEETNRKKQKVSLENLFEKISEDNLQELNIILKGDVHGSVEALTQSIMGIASEEVKVNVIHEGVGAISETDVKLAMASDALIIGFNVMPDINAKKLAAEEEINISLYRIIYEVIDDIKLAISGLLAPDIKEVALGTAEVRQVIKVPKIGLVAGCYVLDGKIQNKAKVRVVRDGVIIHDGEVEGLKRFKDEAKEVAQGYECGMSIVGFNDVKEGDLIEAYVLEEIARTIK